MQRVAYAESEPAIPSARGTLRLIVYSLSL